MKRTTYHHFTTPDGTVVHYRRTIITEGLRVRQIVRLVSLSR